MGLGLPQFVAPWKYSPEAVSTYLHSRITGERSSKRNSTQREQHCQHTSPFLPYACSVEELSGGTLHSETLTYPQGTFDQRQGTEICNSGRRLHRILLNFSSGFSCPFSPGFLCNLARRSPQECGEYCRFPGGEKSAESFHLCGCHVILVPTAAFFCSNQVRANQPIPIRNCFEFIIFSTI